MIQKYLNIIFFISILIPSQSKVGTTSAQFLGIGVGSRAMSMGGAFTSMYNDPSCLYWNPGSMAHIEKDKLQLTRAQWLIDTNWIYGAYVRKIDFRNVFAANLFYLDYGDEEVTTIYDQNGTGNYWSAYDLSIGLYYSILLTNKLSFGGGIKYINQSIYYEEASTVAFDLGLLYKNIDNNYRLGVSISNVGLDMALEGSDLYFSCDQDSEALGNNDNIPCSLSTDAFPLPITSRIGISKDYVLNNNLIITHSIDWVIPNDDVEHINLGIEVGYHKKFFFRSGYRHLGKSDSEENLTMGIGTNFYLMGMDFDLNYTYHNFGVFGYMPYFEFVFNY